MMIDSDWEKIEQYALSLLKRCSKLSAVVKVAVVDTDFMSLWWKYMMVISVQNIFEGS